MYEQRTASPPGPLRNPKKLIKTQTLEIPENTEWVETELPAADAEHIPSLAKYIAQQVVAKLEQTEVSERISLVNSLLTKLVDDLGSDEIESLADTKNAGNLIQLTELKPKSQTKATLRPATPLSNVALLTNNPKEPQLGDELKRELESADRVDLLCSFLKLTGVNVLAPQLEILKSRGIPFRVITTTYMGATDRKAVRPTG